MPALLDGPRHQADGDATRRQFLIGGASLAAVLAGCATPGAQPPARTPTGPATVAHKYGTTTVPAEPGRVVVAGLVEQDALLALGVVPVAATEWLQERPGAIYPWALDGLGSAPLPEVLTVTDGYQVERIAALRPDLIIAVYSDLTEKDFADLSRIAPTVAQPATYVDFGVPWQELTRTVGVAVGRAEQANRLVADVEARFVAARAAHPAFVGASAVVASAGEVYTAFGSQDSRGRFLTDLGFVVPVEIDQLGDSYFTTVSRERLDLLDTDVLIWVQETQAQIDAIDADPLYNSLQVRTQGRDVFVLDRELYAATNFVTVLSLPILLDELVPRIAAAVDGDPATTVAAS